MSLGGSPRASIALFRTSQAMAAIYGRNFVQPDDVKRVAGPVLMHRLILKPESRLRKVTAADVVTEVVADVPVPILKTRKQASKKGTAKRGLATFPLPTAFT